MQCGEIMCLMLARHMCDRSVSLVSRRVSLRHSVWQNYVRRCAMWFGAAPVESAFA